MRRLIVLTLLAALASATPLHAADRETERAITEAINRAVDRVYETTSGCRNTNPLRRAPTVTDDPPSDELLATLGVLRRPQQPEEVLADDAFRHVPAEGVYRRGVRIARSGGRELLVVPARNTVLYRPRPPRCARALRRAFRRIIAKRDAAFRRAARRALEQVIRDEWAGPAPKPREGVFLFDRTPQGDLGAGGGGVSLELIRRRGMFGSSWHAGGPTLVTGLLPDGVASIDATFPAARDRGHAQPLTVTAPVSDNVAAFEVDRAPPEVFGMTAVWRAADGSVLRTVRPPRRG